jgi:hypothetical protein
MCIHEWTIEGYLVTTVAGPTVHVLAQCGASELKVKIGRKVSERARFRCLPDQQRKRRSPLWKTLRQSRKCFGAHNPHYVQRSPAIRRALRASGLELRVCLYDGPEPCFAEIAGDFGRSSSAELVVC